MNTLYQTTLDFLFSQLPAYEKQGAGSYKPGLDNSRALDAFCGLPHKKYQCIHVAGTNGKGSVSHTIASILQEQGYRVGLYTSPHLLDFSERIKVNGRPIETEAVVEFTQRLRDLATSLRCSFFELTSAMAFDYFAQQAVDFAVIEVGLGGQLDSTNIISPVLSIITNISLDHVDLLGDTLQKIAAEKAGIIKWHTPVVIGEGSFETKPVFESKARETESTIYFANEEFDSHIVNTTVDSQIIELFNASEKHHLVLDLQGNYQLHNSKTIYSAIKVLQTIGIEISDKAIACGFAQVKKNTGLLGRWQKLGHSPLIICDTAHNEAGIREVMQQLAEIPCNKLHIVWSNVRDKDLGKIVKLLAKHAHYYISQLEMQRAMPLDDMRRHFDSEKLQCAEYNSLKSALDAAKQQAAVDDVIFIGGSTFTVAELLKNELP